MDQSLRKTVKLKFRQPDVRKLIELGNQLPSWRKEAFSGTYGNLLGLLETTVQTEALTALAQFFDPKYRCFTFQDYQLAPTLEEFEEVLGFPVSNNKPYTYVESYSLTEVMAGILKVKKEDLVGKVTIKDRREGFLKEYLEGEAAVLLDKKEWKAFSDVLAILIYGIVLFPYAENFVDYAAIDVFLAFKKRGQNPTSVVLADLYYSLWERHHKKGGVVWCCLPVLYRWFVSHVFKRHSEEKDKDEWKQFIAGLRGSDISWCTLARDRPEFIYQLDGFPNVPLIGTKGVITYNPTLALRQLGYPMVHPPPAESLVGFELHYRGSEDLPLLRRVTRAWDRPIRKGRAEFGRRSTHVGEGYLQWVQLQVQEIKLPFRVTPREEAEVPEPFPVQNEEAEELKAALSQSQQEKLLLQAQVEKLLQEKKSLEQDNDFKGKSIAKYKQKMDESDRKLADVKSGLKSATSEIKIRNQDRDRAIEDAHTWKVMLDASKKSERDLGGQLKEARAQLEKMVAEYENRLAIERQAKEVVLERFEDGRAVLHEQLIRVGELEDFAKYQRDLRERTEAEHAYLKDEYMKLNDHCLYHQERFSLLSKLCNDAVLGLPRRLRAAGLVMNGFNTPTEVINFVEYVRSVVRDVKAQAECPSPSKKRKSQCFDLTVV